MELEDVEKRTKMRQFTTRLSKYGSFWGNTREFIVKSKISFLDKSAITIQKAWRSYNGQRIFLFYKSLLSIWQSNNSARLLKFINPQESKLIESAAGLHIKFRLGGVSLAFYSQK